jgi:hypothetical protein
VGQWRKSLSCCLNSEAFYFIFTALSNCPHIQVRNVMKTYQTERCQTQNIRIWISNTVKTSNLTKTFSLSIITVCVWHYKPKSLWNIGVWIQLLTRFQFRKLCIRDVDCFYGLVVRVPGYRSRGLGFDSRRYQILWEVVSLERGPLSLVRIIEELLERKVAAPV